jgi:predicted Rossmann fold flavoprotein
MKQIVIIGAGAAGCFAAINAARRFKKNKYIIVEATQRPLTKVLISGGGRCNVTHNCFDPNILVKNYPRGSKELIGAMHRFGAQDTCKWFADEKITLVAEQDGRMFPSTNSSKTISTCLLNLIEKENIYLQKGKKVKTLKKIKNIFNLEFQDGSTLQADMIMLSTGSSPLGHSLAKYLGHTITPTAPSLFTFKITDTFLTGLMGQSVPQAQLSLSFTDEISKKKWQQTGPVLITHWGLSGPAVLKLSAFAATQLQQAKYQAKLTVNWLGNKNYEQCFREIWRHKENNMKKECKAQAFFSLSKKMWIKFLGTESNKKWADISKESIKQISQQLCGQKFLITGKGIFKEEFVTCGGVKRNEINFKTMESKITNSLFFAGEIIDIDGITGGFNFQNAWTGAWIASHNLG